MNERSNCLINYILGIDIGLENLGIAVSDYRGNLIELKTIITSKRQTRGQRLRDISIKLQRIIKQYQPLEVVIEQLYNHPKMQKSTSALRNVEGVLLAVLYQYEPIYYHNMTLKATIKNGKASKKDIIHTLSALYNIKIPDEHQADALSCIYCHLKKAGYLKQKGQV